MTRKIFVIAYQIKQELFQEKFKQLEENSFKDAKEKEEARKSLLDLFAPQYEVITNRMKLETKIQKLQKNNCYYYTYTEVEVNSYAIPDKI